MCKKKILEICVRNRRGRGEETVILACTWSEKASGRRQYVRVLKNDHVGWVTRGTGKWRGRTSLCKGPEA